MSNIVDKIGYAMSLREPLKEALSYFDAISSHCDYRNDSKAVIESVASEYCENKAKIKVSDKFDFPSFCYNMATGIGKTRLMGANIYYLYKTKGYKHFFILAPGSTIYEKLRKETKPTHPKYLFKGLESEMGKPHVFDGDNYTSYTWESAQQYLGGTSEIQLFIFNIGKIFNSRTDTQFNFYKFKETLGKSFADVLSTFDDLVICMDEAHRYYAPASMHAINCLKPVLGIEFTATPKPGSKNIIYSYDVARGAVEGYLKTPVVVGRSNMAGYSSKDIEEMKIRDGIAQHEHRKAILRQYCSENSIDYVKPIVLIACKDTEHAKEIRALIDSETFLDGKYKNRVIEIHSNMTGEESDENVNLLLSIEKNDNPVEIVLHVYKLKEGWDVNNLFTIIPLNAARSEILAMQTIGRGLRLPFGKRTGNEDLDTLDIIAHEHYRELIDDIKTNGMFKHKDLVDTPTELVESVDVRGVMDDNQLDLIDMIFTGSDVSTFTSLDKDETQEELYARYLKTFGEIHKKQTVEDAGQGSLFDETISGDSTEHSVQKSNSSSVYSKNKGPVAKDEFIKNIKEYFVTAISVPKISIHPNSTIKFNWFKVKRTITDFEIAVVKIERFDAINQQLLSSIDAQVLEVDDAMNTLACMLLDSISELSYDDADYIIDIVNQYLNQIDGDEEEKRKIVRRYASLIVDDIKEQMYEHVEKQINDVFEVQKDFIVFRKFVKTFKKDGLLRFDKPFNDKANIKKYLFDGYKKSYYPQNAFDSDTERLFSIILEEDDEVVRWIKPPLNQLGLFWQAGQQYNPDFLVETKKEKYMVEVKASNEVTSDEVTAKAREGIKWCKYASQSDADHKPWTYRLISDDNIKLGNTCRYTLGTAHTVLEEE